MTNDNSPPLLPWAAAVLWIAGSLVPFVFFGQSWGAIWYMINLPLSILVKFILFPIGMPIYVGAVTLMNAALIFGLFSVIVSIYKRLSRR